MWHVFPVRLTICCIAAGFLFALPAMAQSVPDSTPVKPHPGSVMVPAAPDSAAPAKSGLSGPVSDPRGEHYQRGRARADAEASFPGSFVAGFAVGMAMPFVAGAAAGDRTKLREVPNLLESRAEQSRR